VQVQKIIIVGNSHAPGLVRVFKVVFIACGKQVGFGGSRDIYAALPQRNGNGRSHVLIKMEANSLTRHPRL
jgi:hypothetical protein